MRCSATALRSRRSARAPGPRPWSGWPTNIRRRPGDRDRRRHRGRQAATRELNAGYLTVILEGGYTEAICRRPAPTRRKSRPKICGRSQARSISSAQCLFGALCARDRRAARLRLLPFPKSHPQWHRLEFIGSRGALLGRAPSARIWNVRDIYITENGCATTDDRRRTDRVTTPTGSCFCAAISARFSARRPKACRCGAISCGASWTISNGRAGTSLRFGTGPCRLRDSKADTEAQRLLLRDGGARESRSVNGAS